MKEVYTCKWQWIEAKLRNMQRVMKRTFDGVSKFNGYAANIRGEASDILQDFGRTVQDHVKI